jgi:hypothetical protein
VRASPGQVLTPAATLGTGHLGKEESLQSFIFSYNLPLDPSVNLGTLILGSFHHAQENTKESSSRPQPCLPKRPQPCVRREL